MRLATAVSCALVLAALVAAWGLPRLRFDHDTRSLLRADAVADAAERELRDAFGAEDILLVVWEADPTDPDEFARLGRLTKELETIDGLEELYSLASAQVKFSLGGSLRAVKADDLTDPVRREQARAALLDAPVYLKTIYNTELDVVAIAGSIAPGPPEQRFAALRAVRAAAKRHERPGERIRVAGVTAFQLDAVTYAVRDLRRIGLWAAIVAVIVLWLLCRSWRATLAAVFAMGLPPLIALGGAAWSSIPITALATALFPVLAVVGITSTVHLLHAFSEARRDGCDAPAAALAAARRLAPPVTLSLLTTAAAFASLQLTGVPAFRRAGPVVAFGLLTAVPVLLVLYPQLLARLRPPPVSRRAGGQRWLTGPIRRPAVWLAGGVLLAVLSVVAVGRANFEVQALQAFQDDSEIAETYRFLERRLTAAVPVDLILTAAEGQATPAVVADLLRFSRAAERHPDVDSALSVATLVEFGKKVSPITVNETGALVFLRTFFATITRRFEHLATRRYRIKVRVREGAPPAVLDHLERAASECRSGSAELTGLYVRAVATTRMLLGDVARGMLWMIVFVAIVIGLALRSVRLAVVSILPNLIPPLVVGAGAALAGVAFDVAVVAVGAVAVGLAVDDTIHVLFRFRAESRAQGPVSEALARTTRHVGPALCVSTAVLAAGLSCLALSSFLPTARFGLFCAAAAVVALPADLWLLPALVRVAFGDTMKA